VNAVSQVRLAEESEIITKGSTPTTLGFEFEQDGVPFVRAQNLVDGTVSIEVDPLYISQATHKALKRSQILPADVLLSIAGTIGRAAVVPDETGPMNCNQAVAIIRPSGRIDRRFLLHWFSSNDARSQISKGKVTATISNLSLSEIGKLNIPLPPLDEQRRIAAILDKADALRRKRKRAIDLLDNLTQSIFLEMLEDNVDRWSSLTLGEAVEEFRYGTSIKSGPSGFPVLRIPNVIGGEIDLGDLKTVPLDGKEFQRIQMREGDLLLVRTNGNPDYVGRCAVFDRSIEGASEFSLTEFVYASYLIRARLRPNALNPYYVQTFLSSDVGRKAMSERSKTSAGQFNVNTEGLGSIEIPALPLALQDAFAHRRKAVQSAIALHRRASKTADNLFSSLQHRAFAGQL